MSALLLLVSGVLCGRAVASASFGVVADPAQCAAGAQTRPCTYVETLTSQGAATTCLCPGAGNVRRFELTIDYLNVPSLLVGITKQWYAVNGTVPGPTLEVTEGDWVEVTVTNLMLDSTTIHWHGMLQTLTPTSDGVPGLTGCMVPGGGATDASVNVVTYAFRASLAGVYWYHGQ